MLSTSSHQEKRIYRKSDKSEDDFEEIRNGGKLMCRINKFSKVVEIVKEKDRKTTITFEQDRTIIENHNSSNTNKQPK